VLLHAFTHLEKYEFVNERIIPYMKWKNEKYLKPPSRFDGSIIYHGFRMDGC
jgi:hypothetical protein